MVWHWGTSRLPYLLDTIEAFAVDLVDWLPIINRSTIGRAQGWRQGCGPNPSPPLGGRGAKCPIGATPSPIFTHFNWSYDCVPVLRIVCAVWPIRPPLPIYLPPHCVCCVAHMSSAPHLPPPTLCVLCGPYVLRSPSTSPHIFLHPLSPSV